MKLKVTLLVVLFFSNRAFSQDDGSVMGKVSDELGIPVPSAHVQLIHTSKIMVTDVNGHFSFNTVPMGKYTVKVSAIGFETQQQDIDLNIKPKTKLSFRLKPKIQEIDVVTVIGKSAKSELEASAKAVEVLETKEVKFRTGDMGDIIAKVQGVNVRRNGGLGSRTRLSLNGLTGNQVRFFLDDIPLDFSGHVFGLAAVPVNLVDRLEVYKGVVPIKYGADALGGGVNIVTPEIYPGFGGSFYYQTGSFGTHRTALSIQHKNENNNLFFDGNVFFDQADNNYRVDVTIADERGKSQEVNVPRFHDAYRGYGMSFTLGIMDKAWAKEFKLKGFTSDYRKEIQNNDLMTGLPYGAVEVFRKSSGSILTYRQDLQEKLDIDITLGYNHSQRQFVDTAACAYNWFGECFVRRRVSGEIRSQLSASNARDQFTWNDNLFSRANLLWRWKEQHTFRITLAPTMTLQTGDERLDDAFTPLNAHKRLLSWVNGVEHEIKTMDGSLQNIFFVKHYLQGISYENFIATNNTVVMAKKSGHYYGWGNGLNYNFSKRLSTKVSYEYATRLPQSDELFGDGQLTLGSLELAPERSHNLNWELFLENGEKTLAPQWKIRSNLFLRKVSDLIFFDVSGGGENIFENVSEATSTGVELSGNWASKSDRLHLSVSSTYQSFINGSGNGPYEAFKGDRIPNRPYLFANSALAYSFREIFRGNGEFSLFANTRYVHGFFRSWESAGRGQLSFKKRIPGQYVHNAGLTYKNRFQTVRYALTAEMQNLSNEKNFDFFGVQKPGRSLFIKLVSQF